MRRAPVDSPPHRRPPLTPPLTPLRKLGLGAFGAAYVAVGVVVGLDAHDVAAAQPAYAALRPVAVGLGLGQYWHMFSAPPKWNTTLTVEVFDGQGGWTALPSPSQPDAGPVRLRNWRLGKAEEFVRDDGYEWLRGRITRNLCERPPPGTPVLGVRFSATRVRITRPDDRVAGPPYPAPEVRELSFGPYWCAP